MDKQDFVKLLKEFKKDTSDLAKDCRAARGKQVQTRALLNRLEVLATRWFEQIEPVLRSTYGFDEDVVFAYREPFGKLLELSGGRPSKRVVQTIFRAILRDYHAEILVPVQKHRALLLKFPGLDAVISHAIGLEVEYLTEAVDCARMGKRRAAVIMAWCAAVNRLHLYLEKKGFAKFNRATVRMSAIQTGRYKRFNKRFNIQNLADLRMSVFDRDLLWVLEFLGAIDGNQHERLGICLTVRNTSAHPGEATLSDENVLSFFSDIDSMIFANPEFSL
jgi:hypothetical protein